MKLTKDAKRKLFEQPQLVVNRWFRMKAIRITRSYVEGFFRVYLRLKLRLQERERASALKTTFDVILRECRKSQNSKYEATKVFYNIALFFLLAERDMQAMKIDALSHPDEWKRNLSLRVMLLVMHEWDMSKVAPAKKMREVYEKAGISQNLRDEMTQALRKVNKAQVKAKKLLSNARHSTIAHRESNAMLQYNTITGIKLNETLDICQSFYEAVDLFNKVLPKLIIEAGSPASLIKQYSANI